MVTAKKAFVLMPFAPQYISYYQGIFKPALEAASYQVSRADDLFSPGFVMAEVQKAILETHLILCDMSERNPNVFYELGLAHAIGKPVILVAQQEEDIPFDLRHLRAFIYNITHPQWKESISQSITQAARAVDDSYKVFPLPLIKSENVNYERKTSPQSVEVTIESHESIFLFDKALFIRADFTSFAHVKFTVGSPGKKNENFETRRGGTRFIYESNSSKYEIRVLCLTDYDAMFVVTILENK